MDLKEKGPTKGPKIVRRIVLTYSKLNYTIVM